MVDLSVKDFKFHAKYVAFAIVLGTVAMIGMPLSENSILQLIIVVYFPLLLTNYLIGKFCYLEDTENIKTFLKSLPISTYKRIGSRYIEGISLIVIFSAVATVIKYSLYIHNVVLSLQVFLMITSIYIFYLGIYLALFYFKNFQIAQHALSISMLIFVAIFLVFKNLGIDVQVFNNPWLISIVVAISSIACFTSFYVVCKNK